MRQNKKNQAGIVSNFNIYYNKDELLNKLFAYTYYIIVNAFEIAVDESNKMNWFKDLVADKSMLIIFFERWILNVDNITIILRKWMDAKIYRIYG